VFESCTDLNVQKTNITNITSFTWKSNSIHFNCDNGDILVLGTDCIEGLRIISDDCLENAGTSTSHNPMGFHGLLHG
jgi:hypothetical protein